MTRTDIENRIREIEWPAASAALRSRVLAAAPAAPPVMWSDRVWFSRAFRWSVAAVFIAFISVGQWSGSNLAEPAKAEAARVQTLAIEAGLPTDMAESLARRSMFAGAPQSSSTRARALQQFIEKDGGH